MKNVRVRCRGRRNVPLASGMLHPGETGMATLAELATMGQYIQAVEKKEEANDRAELQRSVLEQDGLQERSGENPGTHDKPTNRKPNPGTKPAPKKRGRPKGSVVRKASG